MKRALVLLTVLVACTSAGSGPTTAPVPRSRSSAASSLPSPSAVLSPADTRTYERPCEESVFGTLGPHWRDHSLVVGPIAFVGLSGAAGAPERSLGVRGSRALPQKVLAVVDRGGPVTVSVAPPASAFVGLIYDPHDFPDGPVGLNSTDLSVTFHPCAGDQHRAQFNGALLVLHPGCAELDVMWSDGHRRARIPFAGGRCE